MLLITPLVWSWLAIGCARGPSVERIDHSDPKAYLALPPSLGTERRIREAATEIGAVGSGGFEERLHDIHVWMGERLQDVPEESYRWHTFDEIVDSGKYGGCAAHSVVYGSLARALGIPTVWVKSMDVEWIQAFRAGPEPETWSGHVFLEVFDGKRWLLLDAQGQTLYTDYDPRMRLLPGDRYAYDKGGDPYELILSTRWGEWKEQTREYFQAFDLTQLPVPPGKRLGNVVYIAGDNPGWGRLAQRYRQHGWEVGFSGNAEYERWLPTVAGQTLVVACLGKCRSLPEPYGSRYVPRSLEELAKERAEPGWVERWTAEDGTRVVAVYGLKEEDLLQQIEKLAP